MPSSSLTRHMKCAVVVGYGNRFNVMNVLINRSGIIKCRYQYNESAIPCNFTVVYSRCCSAYDIRHVDNDRARWSASSSGKLRYIR